MKQLSDASSRIAFAALIHDIGKFFQRTQREKATNINKQLYCPQADFGWTHTHAALTAQAIDEIENLIPSVRGDDLYPFKNTQNVDIDDSLINSASMHHKPKTFLQTVISVADRLSSAFEREEYENYKKQKDNDDYITARLITPFENLDKETVTQNDLNYVYPLEVFSASACFSQKRLALTQEQSVKEYEFLWEAFKNDLKQIPQQSFKSWKSWLDHFDTLWLTYTHAIPSASAFIARGKINSTIASVSLYDHSKSTAALATALWRYYEAKKLPENEMLQQLQSETDSPFLIIQGDMSGIQNFIFAQGSETQANASKILRGRSFFVSLISECAALKILEELGLPSTSQIINAAGHFMIVAPNTEEVIQKLQTIKKEMEDWFYHELYAVSNISLAWKSASKSDFTAKHFKAFQKELHYNLEKNKLSQMDLCTNTYSPVFYDFVKHCSDICESDGRFPAGDKSKLCPLCADILRIGEDLTKNNYIVIGKNLDNSLKTKIFGYEIQLRQSEPTTQINCLCVWDISLPIQYNQKTFNGYARRYINAFVPKNNDNTIKTFKDIVKLAEGQKSLMTLKGDIDNLGFLFQERITHTTFASYASMSRRINAFFTVVLPVLCYQKYRDVYTIFAGGDDFFFIAPWDKQIAFLTELKAQFDVYVCNNITFSAGMIMAHEKTPIRVLAELTESELEEAKSLENKNGVCCFNQAVTFGEFLQLLKEADNLDLNKEKYKLSTGFIYRMIYLCEKAQSALIKPENAIWRSWLAYRITRHLNEIDIDKEQGISDLSTLFGKGIETYLEKYKIALFTHLYKLRGEEK